MAASAVVRSRAGALTNRREGETEGKANQGRSLD